MPRTLGERLRELAESPRGPAGPALVLQGGCMRGIYSMAALSVLEEEGLRDAFSHVVGSSAGAINGAYFLAGQAGQAVRIYAEDLCDSRFVSPLRFWKVLDVDHLIDVTMKRDLPLDVAAMDEARGTLHSVLTDAETAQPRIVSSRQPGIDLHEVFRATAAVPGLYNRKVRIGTRRYVDGGIASQVPVDVAFRLGARAALVVLTRGAGHRRPQLGAGLRALLSVVPGGPSPAVRARLCTPDPAHEEAMRSLERERLEAPRRTWTLQPSDSGRLADRTTADPARLWDCAELARADMRALLRQPCDELIPQRREAVLHSG